MFEIIMKHENYFLTKITFSNDNTIAYVLYAVDRENQYMLQSYETLSEGIKGFYNYINRLS